MDCLFQPLQLLQHAYDEFSELVHAGHAHAMGHSEVLFDHLRIEQGIRLMIFT